MRDDEYWTTDGSKDLKAFAHTALPLAEEGRAFHIDRIFFHGPSAGGC